MRSSLFMIILLLAAPVSMSAQQYDDILKNRKVHLYQDGYKTVFTVGEYNRSAKRDKDYHWYGTQQVRVTTGGYSGKVLHGRYTRYYPDNNLAETGAFKHGLKEGRWQSWYRDGAPQKESEWKNGEETGAFRIWGQDGQLQEQGRLHKGQRDGRLLAWNKDAGNFARQYFDRGKQISREEYQQRNVFSRTGDYIGRQWHTLFSKKDEAAGD